MAALITKKYIKARPWKLWPRLYAYFLTEGRPLTTRGQWINPFLFLLFRIQKVLPQLKEVKSPIYILGTGRSGSTILGTVLSMHKQVGYLNEPKALWKSAKSGEDLIGSYSRGEASYRLDEADATPKVVSAISKLYGFYLRVSCSQRIVDKYPELIFRVPFIKAIFPDAKFLFLSRNGYDTSQSIAHWSDRLGKESDRETHDWWGADRRKWLLLVDQIIPEHEDLAPHQQELRDWTIHTDMALVEWIVSMREGMELCRQYPDFVMQVPYESLCGDVESTLQKIVEFAGLSEDKVFEKFGGESLTSPPKYSAQVMPCVIKTAFERTMLELGYSL